MYFSYPAMIYFVLQSNPSIASKQQLPSTSGSMSFIPINTTCGGPTCSSSYVRPKSSGGVISSVQNSGPGNPYYPPGIPMPQVRNIFVFDHCIENAEILFFFDKNKEDEHTECPTMYEL